jgi:hypothetical protein
MPKVATITSYIVTHSPMNEWGWNPCPPPLAGEVAAKLTEGGTGDYSHCKSPLSRVPRQLPRKQGSKPLSSTVHGGGGSEADGGGNR